MLTLNRPGSDYIFSSFITLDSKPCSTWAVFKLFGNSQKVLAIKIKSKTNSSWCQDRIYVTGRVFPDAAERLERAEGQSWRWFASVFLTDLTAKHANLWARAWSLGDDSIGWAFIYKRRAPVAVDRPICLTNNVQIHFSPQLRTVFVCHTVTSRPGLLNEGNAEKLAKLGYEDRADSCSRRSSCERWTARTPG